MSSEYGFVFSKEDCIQCRGCEVACKSWRNGELGVNKRRVSRIWSGSFPVVKMATASVSCMQCADPACVEACPQQAISKRPEDGIVVVDRENASAARAVSKPAPTARRSSARTP
jgi:anaerobic dimethyl sulfoxide reductase subunit B (iron-sulfur subunit)